MELSHTQFTSLMKRFPDFELSYETISHKKVSTTYDLALAIPFGKKAFLWFTYHQDRDVVYFLDINREKKIIKATQYPYPAVDRLPLGTILYGTLVDVSAKKCEGDDPLALLDRFVIEDIYWFEGIPMKKMKLIHKLAFLEKTMQCLRTFAAPFRLFLPSMWKCVLTESSECPTTIPANVACYMAYPAHHIQYRASQQTMPFLNVTPSTRGPLPTIKTAISPVHARPIMGILSPMNKPKSLFEPGIPCKANYNKPQYRHASVFQVVADVQNDIYHLFAYGRNKEPVYYNVACVPTYRSSVFLNGLFRKIRENQNLDYIEESDDEDDFENTAEDKYVDTKKVLHMECVFHAKFKKWVPTRVVPKGSKIVHVNLLSYF